MAKSYSPEVRALAKKVRTRAQQNLARSKKTATAGRAGSPKTASTGAIKSRA